MIKLWCVDPVIEQGSYSGILYSCDLKLLINSGQPVTKELCNFYSYERSFIPMAFTVIHKVFS